MAQAELNAPSEMRPSGRVSVFLVALFSALPAGPPSAAQTTPSPQPLSVRDVRVRLATGATRVRLRSDLPIQLADRNGSQNAKLDAGSWHVFKVSGNDQISCGTRRFSQSGVTLSARKSASITLSLGENSGWSLGREYAGLIRIVRPSGGKLRVTNEVDVEPYVSSVVAHEIWPTFEREAYRAQAIAARTYVLYTMIRRRSADYDVKSNQGSQVYRGIRTDSTGRRAQEAARFTRGIVVTWGTGNAGRLFSAFYSAVCGGMTQAAGHFGSEHDIRPLSGGAKCDYCKDAPGETYRWGPVRIDKDRVRSRLEARNPKAGFSGSISKIEVVGRSPQGRPIKLTITGSTGKSLTLSAESFRMAVGAKQMRSADCTIRVTDRHIVLENGRGFGHGVGLCQWGAQGLAQHGQTAAEILRFYYPGSQLARAY